MNFPLNPEPLCFGLPQEVWAPKIWPQTVSTRPAEELASSKWTGFSTKLDTLGPPSAPICSSHPKGTLPFRADLTVARPDSAERIKRGYKFISLFPLAPFLPASPGAPSAAHAIDHRLAHPRQPRRPATRGSRAT